MPPKFKRNTGDDISKSRAMERAILLADSESDDDIFGAPRVPRPVSQQPKASTDQIGRVKNEITGVVNVMQGNISKVLDRGAKLEDLQERSEDLEMNAFNFRSGSRKLQRRLWWQNCKLKLVFVVVIAIILVIIIVPIILKNKKPAET